MILGLPLTANLGSTLRSNQGSTSSKLATVLGTVGLAIASPWAIAESRAESTRAPATTEHEERANAIPAPRDQEAPPKVEPAAQAVTHWYDKLQLELLVDAYAGYNYNKPTPQSPTEIAKAGDPGAHGGLAAKAIRGGNQLRGYDVTNGFALQWIGLDAAYTVASFSAVTTLRFGPSANLLVPPEDSAVGLANVRQAFVSWKALPALTLDLGKFDTPFGAEGLDTSSNINYTRSAVFWYAQPATHTGLRATWEALPSLSLQGMVVNGWDSTIPRNAGKSVGGMVIWKPLEKAKVSAGYLVGPEGSDHEGTPEDQAGVTGRLRHSVDLFFDAMLTDKWRWFFNLDYVTEELAPSAKSKQVSWYGGTMATAYDLRDWLFASVRGSHFWDQQGFATGTAGSVKMVEGTLTLGLRPAPGFLFMLDNRVDVTPFSPLFQRRAEGTSHTQVTTTLGFCITTGSR